MLGTIIAQLFRLQNAPSPTGVISLYILAIPLACICQGAALLTTLTGSHRYWRMQNAMARGQALAAGWEYWLMIGILGSVSRPSFNFYPKCDRFLLMTEKVLLILFVVILAVA